MNQLVRPPVVIYSYSYWLMYSLVVPTIYTFYIILYLLLLRQYLIYFKDYTSTIVVGRLETWVFDMIICSTAIHSREIEKGDRYVWKSTKELIKTPCEKRCQENDPDNVCSVIEGECFHSPYMMRSIVINVECIYLIKRT